MLDTSVLVGATSPGDLEGAIGAASLGVPLMTHNIADFELIADLVDVRAV